MTPTAGQTPSMRVGRGEFFRLCRLVHGWFSAIAFLVLVFFAATGILLNHPGWSTGKAPPALERHFQLTDEELELLRDSAAPAELLGELSAKHISVKGSFSAGNRTGRDVFTRMQGVRGLTDLRANLGSGAVSAVIEGAPPIRMLNDLHRAEHAGTAWRLFVDAIAILLILMSLIGYVIFLSMRFRLRTALILTALSSVGLVGLFLFTVT